MIKKMEMWVGQREWITGIFHFSVQFPVCVSNLLYRFVDPLEQIGLEFRMESGILIWLSIYQLLFTSSI